MSKDNVQRLIAVANMGLYEVRRSAIEELLAIGSSAIPELVRSALEPGSLYVWDALEAFGRVAADAVLERRAPVEGATGYGEARVLAKSPRSWPVLRAGLDSDDDGIRAYSAHGLGRLGDRRAIPRLRELLDDPEARIDAARALAALGDEASLPGLIALLDNPDPDVAAAAVDALGMLDGPIALGRVISAMDDARLVVRIAAVANLAPRDEWEVTRALTARLDQLRLPRDDHEADAILEALGPRSDPAAEPSLTAILDSPLATSRSHPQGERLGDLAVEALDSIGTESARAAAEAWRHRIEQR